MKQELIENDVNRRRALGHGLGVLWMRRNLCAAAALVPALREEKLPDWVPPFAQGFVRKVWRLSRKA